jgi:hypothetical protein
MRDGLVVALIAIALAVPFAIGLGVWASIFWWAFQIGWELGS